MSKLFTGLFFALSVGALSSCAPVEDPDLYRGSAGDHAFRTQKEEKGKWEGPGEEEEEDDEEEEAGGRFDTGNIEDPETEDDLNSGWYLPTKPVVEPEERVDEEPWPQTVVDCDVDQDCAPTWPICHPVELFCVDCLTDDDCAVGARCDLARYECF